MKTNKKIWVIERRVDFTLVRGISHWAFRLPRISLKHHCIAQAENQAPTLTLCHLRTKKIFLCVCRGDTSVKRKQWINLRNQLSLVPVEILRTSAQSIIVSYLILENTALLECHFFQWQRTELDIHALPTSVTGPIKIWWNINEKIFTEISSYRFYRHAALLLVYHWQKKTATAFQSRTWQTLHAREIRLHLFLYK